MKFEFVHCFTLDHHIGFPRNFNQGVVAFLSCFRKPNIVWLCLVFGKFEGKCKGKKIERKSKRKEKVKKNKKYN